MKPRTRVEQKIADVEKAQEDYRREEFRKDVTRTLSNKPIEQIPVVMENLRNQVRWLLPGTLTENDEARRKFAEVMNLVASDVDVSNEQVPPMALRMYRTLVKQWANDIVDIEKAFEKTVSGLRLEANPFQSEKDATRFANFMMELNLVGGPAKRADKLAEQVRQTLKDQDPGGLQFWERNLGTLADQLPGPINMSEHTLLEELKRKVSSLIDSKRTVKQREAAEREKAIETAWKVNEMETSIGTADFVIAEAKTEIPQNLPSWLRPRPRTEAEEKTATGRAMIREAEAR